MVLQKRVVIEINIASPVSPAMNKYRLVTSPPLNYCHLCYYINDTTEVGAVATRTPVGYVQLYNLVVLAQL